MSVIDFIFVIIIIAGVVRGGYRGSIKQIASILALIVAIIITNLFGDAATGLLGRIVPELSDEQWLASFLAHGLLFVFVYLTVSLGGKLVRNIAASLNLGVIDRIIGAIFCTLKYLLIISLILNAWHAISPNSGLFASSTMMHGALMRFTLDFAPMLIDSPIIPAVGNVIG